MVAASRHLSAASLTTISIQRALVIGRELTALAGPTTCGIAAMQNRTTGAACFSSPRPSVNG
jgi:hypothetical protein